MNHGISVSSLVMKYVNYTVGQVDIYLGSISECRRPPLLVNTIIGVDVYSGLSGSYRIYSVCRYT